SAALCVRRRVRYTDSAGYSRRLQRCTRRGLAEPSVIFWRPGQSFMQTSLILAILLLSCAAYAEPQRNKEPQYNEELQGKESQGKAPQRIVSLNLCIDQLLLAL